MKRFDLVSRLLFALWLSIAPAWSQSDAPIVDLPGNDVSGKTVTATGGGPTITLANQIGLDGYGYFGPTTQPANAVADLIGSNDQYHDNLGSLQNNSKSYWQSNISCTFTNGSPTVTAGPQTTGASIGNYLEGSGIPPGPRSCQD